MMYERSWKVQKRGSIHVWQIIREQTQEGNYDVCDDFTS